MEPILSPLEPIPMKERLSLLFVEYGRLDVIRAEGRRRPPPTRGVD